MATHKLNTLINANVAPYSAHHIGVYDKQGNRLGSVGLGQFKPNYGKRLYRFGIISDVHNQTDQASENMADLENALNYFNTKEDIEFTVITGDLTKTYNQFETELTKFQSIVESISDATPVYPTTGNHDCPSSGVTNIELFKSKTGISEFFTSDATYSYEITKQHTVDGKTVTDHFLFLGMKQWNFTTAYLDSDIVWLGTKLEQYKNDRCFVLTHLFFSDCAGNFKSVYPSYNWLSGSQYNTLKSYLTLYPRAIWFSGHSHWKWYLQGVEDKANVYPLTNVDRNMAWTVHIPSCAEPIDSSYGDSSISGTRVTQDKQSEGAVIDVYEDYIDIRGIEFKGKDDTDYNVKYVPIAQYRLHTQPATDAPDVPENPDSPDEPSDTIVKYMTADMAQEHTGKNRLYKVDSITALDSVTTGAGVYVDETTHDMTVKICAEKIGFFIADGGSYVMISSAEGKMTGTDIAEGATVTILHDGVEWISTEPTTAQKTKIGFYGGGWATGGGSTTYTLDSGITIDTSKGCIQLQASSSFSGVRPAVFTIKNFRYILATVDDGEEQNPSTPDTPDEDDYHYLTQDMVFLNPRKSSGTTFAVNADHDLSVTFTADSQGIMINDGGELDGNFLVGGYITTNKNSATPDSMTDHIDVRFDGPIEWSPAEPTATAKSKIGIWATAGGYNTTDGVVVTATAYGSIELNSSSTFSSTGGTYPITMILRNFRFKKV